MRHLLFILALATIPSTALADERVGTWSGLGNDRFSDGLRCFAMAIVPPEQQTVSAKCTTDGRCVASVSFPFLWGTATLRASGQRIAGQRIEITLNGNVFANMWLPAQDNEAYLFVTNSGHPSWCVYDHNPDWSRFMHWWGSL